MASSLVAPPPIGTPFLDVNGRITAPWVSWLGTITSGSTIWSNGGAASGALLAANNLGDLTSIIAARLHLGLGSAALQDLSAFDGAGAAAAAQAASDPLGSATAAVAAIPNASATTRGLLTAADWSTFNSKQAALVFGASGSSHSQGIVPDPGATIATTHFLREDATWAIPPSSGGSTVTIKVNGTVLASPISVNGTPLA